ncbi:undecaprenyl-diphosphate phosphatase, partial [uncultured Microbacterium sp.]|uniref:undecaprenyl-diphosphate phosphatase n=1 Tax=uncultured Microbacterium sp. TaxID=191216 RepID=UPI00258A1D64
MDLTYLQAVVIGLLQGVTELFPISSLGHSILVPAWIGGEWQSLVTQGDSSGHTPFLAFVVALHVATALALIVFYWRDWVAVIRGFFWSLSHRSLGRSEARLAWLLIIGTIPVGVIGLLLEKPLRVLFSTPLVAAVFLTLNGLVLLTAELLRRRQTILAGRAARAAGRAVAVRARQRGAALQPRLLAPRLQPLLPAPAAGYANQSPHAVLHRSYCRDTRERGCAG